MVLGAGRRASLFSVGLFGCVFVCVFSSFWTFFGPFLALGGGRRAALFSVGLFGCVLVFCSFFMKAILSFFLMFWSFFFVVFFLFIFALTFHKCQFVKKAFLFIFIFGLFYVEPFWGLFFGFDSGLFWRFLGCSRWVA